MLHITYQSTLPPPSHSPIPIFCRNLDMLSLFSCHLQCDLHTFHLSPVLVRLGSVSRSRLQLDLHCGELAIEHVLLRLGGESIPHDSLTKTIDAICVRISAFLHLQKSRVWLTICMDDSTIDSLPVRSCQSSVWKMIWPYNPTQDVLQRVRSGIYENTRSIPSNAADGKLRW
jgi:hypothetical protein